MVIPHRFRDNRVPKAKYYLQSHAQWLQESHRFRTIG